MSPLCQQSFPSSSPHLVADYFCLLFFISFRHKLEIQMICLTTQLSLMHHSILPLLFLLLLLLLLLMVDFSVCPPSFNCPLCHTSHGLSSPLLQTWTQPFTIGFVNKSLEPCYVCYLNTSTARKTFWGPKFFKDSKSLNDPCDPPKTWKTLRHPSRPHRNPLSHKNINEPTCTPPTPRPWKMSQTSPNTPTQPQQDLSKTLYSISCETLQGPERDPQRPPKTFQRLQILRTAASLDARYFERSTCFYRVGSRGSISRAISPCISPCPPLHCHVLHK